MLVLGGVFYHYQFPICFMNTCRTKITPQKCLLTHFQTQYDNDSGWCGNQHDQSWVLLPKPADIMWGEVGCNTAGWGQYSILLNMVSTISYNIAKYRGSTLKLYIGPIVTPNNTSQTPWCTPDSNS